MIRYVITNRHLLHGGIAALLRQLHRNIADGVDYIQIREKDLADRDLHHLTASVVQAAQEAGARARVLVNGRVDIALAAGAHGVHLPADSIAASQWRRIVPAGFLIGVSCHTLAELRQDTTAADYALYAPVFAPLSKTETLTPLGLDGLRQGCRVCRVPVLALGGITWHNAPSCVDAGAAGVAGITLFQAAEATTRYDTMSG